MKKFILDYQKEYNDTIQNINSRKLQELYNILQLTFKNEKNIFILGNGGSSASASHWVCDFNKGVSYQRPEIKSRFYSLTDNTPIITAYGNDVGYEFIFVEQLKILSNTDDLIIFLSVSGNSPNLVNAQKYAKEAGLRTVSITGNQHNLLKGGSDLSINIPSNNYGIVEDCHMYICHVISQYFVKK